MPIANVNRIVFENSIFTIPQPICTIRLSLLRFGIYYFIIHINLAAFYWDGTSPIGRGWQRALWYSVSL